VSALSDIYARLLDALAALASLILLAMVAVVSADILLRDAFASGISWADEVSEYALYVITVFTAPWLLRRGQHVRIDVILTIVPSYIAWVMEAVGDALGFAVCLTLVRYGFSMTYDSWSTGSTTIKNLIFPEWWLLSLLPACFFLLAIEFVFRFYRLVSGERTHRSDATSVT
jgi:TRAP-type transport system small permease protein